MSFAIRNHGHTLRYKGCEIVLRPNGNITRAKDDAIVNAAKPALTGGGGVDGAIHKRAGKELAKACVKVLHSKHKKKLDYGKAITTKGFKLPVKYVIHTVGPNMKENYHKKNFKLAKQDLYNAYKSSIGEANKKKLRSIGFSGISVGSYKFPEKDAARIALKAICDRIKKGTSVKRFDLFAHGTNVAEYTKLFARTVKNGKIG